MQPGIGDRPEAKFGGGAFKKRRKCVCRVQSGSVLQSFDDNENTTCSNLALFNLCKLFYNLFHYNQFV